MQDKIGTVFDGIITGVTDWGLYVEEKESKAEGMVRLASIRGDFFTVDPGKYRVKGQKTGTIYALGSEVRVRLTRADLEMRQMDFEISSGA
jgi:exoribonuclease R